MPVAITAPAAITMTRSQSAATSGMTWLDTRTAQPAAASRVISRADLARAHHVEAVGRFVEHEVGRFVHQRARQRETPAFTHRQRPAGARAASAASPSWASSRSIRALTHRGGDALQFGAVLDVLANREVIVDADVFRERRRAWPARRSAARATSMPSTSTRPASGRDQAGDRADRGGLAGAVRAEQAVTMPSGTSNDTPLTRRVVP